jgi:hypothetical protein
LWRAFDFLPFAGRLLNRRTPRWGNSSRLTGVVRSALHLQKDMTIMENNTLTNSASNTLDDAKVIWADALIAQTGLVEMFAHWRQADSASRHASSRLPLVSDRAVLVGLLLMALLRIPATSKNLMELFMLDLSTAARTLLGLDRLFASAEPVSADRVYSATNVAYNRLLTLIDPYSNGPQSMALNELAADPHFAGTLDGDPVKQGRLDEVTAAFLHMTFAQQPPELRAVSDRLDIALASSLTKAPKRFGKLAKRTSRDARSVSAVSSRAHGVGRVDRRTGLTVEESIEENQSGSATFGGTAGTRGPSTVACGWEATIAVRVNSLKVKGLKVPQLAVAAHFVKARTNGERSVISTLSGAMATGMRPGIVDAARGCFSVSSVEGLHKPVASLGFSPLFELRDVDLGPQARVDGAVLIEGAFYCDGIPPALANASLDFRRGVIDEPRYRSLIETRSRYRLRPQGKRGKNGSLRLVHSPACREAFGSRVSEAEGLISSSHSAVTVSNDVDVRSRQALPYASAEWKTFHSNARAAAERLTAKISEVSSGDAASFVAAQMDLTLRLTAYNLREIDRFINPTQRKIRVRTRFLSAWSGAPVLSPTTLRPSASREE